MRPTKNVLTRPLVLVALIASACSDDSSGSSASADDPERDRIVAEMTAAMMEYPEASEFASEEQISCYGGSIYDALGTERLQELGVLDSSNAVVGDGFNDVSNLSADEGNAVVDSINDCIGFESLIQAGMAADGLSPEQAQCYFDGIGEDGIRDMFLITTVVEGEYTGDPDIFSKNLAVLTECSVN